MHKIKAWLDTTKYKNYIISVASTDASFRKYYRLNRRDKSFILMDSSLELSSITPFLNVTKKLLNVDVNAPHILEKNINDGYLILEDFGDNNLLDVLNEDNFKKHYLNAIDEIVKMQEADIKDLPVYDNEFLKFEMNLMSEWYFEKNLNLQLDTAQRQTVQSTLNAISKVVLAQPQKTFVHRDFHSRNIMITSDKLGIIDYQDAMSGAITYDLVSLLKDCYIKFNHQEIKKLALLFRDKKGLNVSDKEFIGWFDFMGMQRHIKVLGIFSRLYLRDGKSAYLKDIPLVLAYLIETAQKYKETEGLALFLKSISS